MCRRPCHRQEGLCRRGCDAFRTVAVGVLDGRGGRLIHQAQHAKAGGLRRFLGEEALIAVGIGGDAKHDFELLVGRRGDWNARRICVRRAPIISARRSRRGRAWPPARSSVCGPAVAQASLQRAQNRPAGRRPARQSLPSIEPLLSPYGNNRRKPVGSSGRQGFRNSRAESCRGRPRRQPRGWSRNQSRFSLASVYDEVTAANSVENPPGITVGNLQACCVWFA